MMMKFMALWTVQGLATLTIAYHQLIAIGLARIEQQQPQPPPNSQLDFWRELEGNGWGVAITTMEIGLVAILCSPLHHLVQWLIGRYELMEDMRRDQFGRIMLTFMAMYGIAVELTRTICLALLLSVIIAMARNPFVLAPYRLFLPIVLVNSLQLLIQFLGWTYVHFHAVGICRDRATTVRQEMHTIVSGYSPII